MAIKTINDYIKDNNVELNKTYTTKQLQDLTWDKKQKQMLTRYAPEKKPKKKNFVMRAMASVDDFFINAGKGFLNTVEGISDTISYGMADVIDFFGADDAADAWRDKIKRDLVNEMFDNKTIKNIEYQSYGGDMYRSIAQGTGNVAAMAGAGQALGVFGGTSAKANAIRTGMVSFSSSYGNTVSQALRNGEDLSTARKAGIINGTAEAISEQFFNGLPGVKGENWGGKVTGKIGSAVEKYFGTKTGKIAMKILDSSGEGLEEIISNVLVSTGNDVAHWIDKNYTYGMENQTGNVFKDAWKSATSKESLDAFISASLTSALTNGGNTILSNVQKNNIIKSYAQENNMSVKEVKESFNQSVQQKADYIQQQKPGMNLGEKIESEQQAKIMTLDELKNDTFVKPGTETEAYQFKESDNQKVNEMNQSLIEANANNTQATREVAKTAERLIKDLNLEVKFTNNEQIKSQMDENQLKELGDKVINGYVKDGVMYLNIDSNDLSNFTIGHETKHFFEASEELNEALNDSLEKFAREKGIYEKDLEDITKLYTDKDGKVVGDPKAELMANYVGQFFTDYNFVNNLSVKNPTLFQRAMDFFQKLYYKATGQQEKLMIKQINDNISKVYREYAKTNVGQNISSSEAQLLSDKTKTDIKEAVKVKKQEQLNKESKQVIKQETKERQQVKQKQENVLPIAEKVETKEKQVLPTKEKVKEETKKETKKVETKETKKKMSLSEQLEKQGFKILEQAESKRQGMIDNFKEYLEENKITKPTQKDIDDSLVDILGYDNEDMSENAKNEKLYNKYVREYMKENNIPFKEKQTKYSLSQDNRGKKLTKEQQEYFKDSKIRDDKGNLLRVYHGTPEGGFTVFDESKIGTKLFPAYGEGFYFAKNKSTSDSYKGYGENGEIKTVYLNITNPYRANDSDIGRINKESLIKQGYDGVIAGAMGDEYVAFYPNQIKNIDNTNPTTDSDIRYSLSPKGEMVDNETGEKVTLDISNTGNTGNLMAIHNLNESKLKGILELGGFPVPSIAITTTENVGSNQFGDISVLFDKSTIDPAIKKNEVYDRDVWSPTFPQIDYELNDDAIDRVANELGIEDWRLRDAAKDNSKPEYLIERLLREEQLIDKYVKDNNIDYETAYKDAEIKVDMHQRGEKIRQFIIDNDFDFKKLYKNKKLQQEYFDLIKDYYDNSTLPQAVKENLYNEKISQLKDFIDIQKGAGDLEPVRQLKKYQDDFDLIKSGENKTIDEWQTNKNKRDAAVENGIEDYLKEQVKDIYGEKGIRNDRDYLDSRGNRRSFWQLHDEYNLENIVDALTQGDTTGTQNWFAGYGQIQANMANQFNSISDIKANENRLTSLAENNTILEEARNNIENDIDEIVAKNDTDMNIVSELLADFARGDLTVDNFKKLTRNYYQTTQNVSDELINKIIDDLNNLKDLPTDYFEAKPQRAVGLDEVQQIVIPNNLDAEFKKQLQENGLQYTEYDPSIEGDRQRVINQFDDLKFSLSREGELQSEKYNDLYTPKVKNATRLSDLKRKEVELPTEQENALKTSENEQKENVEKPTRREVIDRNRELARDLLGDITQIKDKKRGISYQINTMKRNLRDIMSKEQAQKMYDTYFKGVTENNAKIENDITSYNERIQKYNINDKESTYIQMLGELKHNPETTLTKEQVEKFYQENSNKIDQQKCENAVKEFRQIYDELIERVNDVLTDNGYKPIEYRKGYFPHFIEEKATSRLGKFAEKLGWKVKKGQLPTDIAGITDQFKPGKVWTSFSQQRTGDATDYNALKGLDNYLRGAMDVIHHTNDIQKLRALENEIRYQYSSKGIQDKINEIYADENLDMEEKNEAIANLTSNIRESGLGNFVTEIRNYTDNLANKKNIGDRSMEQILGRDTYSIMSNINGRVSANMVGANISSAITNFIPITQAWSQIKTKNLMRGMYDTIKSSIKNDNFADKSVFLTNRTKQAERLYNTKLDKISQKLGIPFEAVDSFTANTIVRGKYYDNIAKGMSEQEAIANADEFAKDVISGRSKGDQPTIFNRKNPLYKLFTAFQLEVNNQYGYMFKDIPVDMADEAKKKIVGAFIKMFFGAWLYNEISEKFTGRRAAFDPIDMAISDVKTLSNEDMDLGDKIQSIVKDTSQELPFISGVTGGGRLPIQGAIPYSNPLEMITSTFEDIGKLDDPDKRKTAINNLKKEWSKPVYYLLFPVAGGQVKKTVEGLSMYDKDLPIAGSYTNSGKLRFEADTSLSGKVQAAVFGQYASKNAREYFDKGYAPLTEKQINTVLDADMSVDEYRKYNQGIKEQGSTEDKINYISDLPISNEQKNVLANSTVSRKNKIDMENYDNYGSLDEFDYANNNPDKYLTIKNITDYDTFKGYKEDLTEIKKQYDNTNDRKQAVYQYINSLPLSIDQKLMLQKIGAGYSVKQYRKRLQNYINSLDLTKEEKESIDKVLFN